MGYQTVESGRWLATQSCNIFIHLAEYTLPVRKTSIWFRIQLIAPPFYVSANDRTIRE